MWIKANPNPYRTEEPDCVVRAIAIALDDTWESVHWDLCMLSHYEHTMPSTNWLWEKYLLRNGFEKFLLPETCPQCTTVKDFARMYPEGTYVLAAGDHAVAVIGGNWYDAWDSGSTVPIAFYRKKRRSQ